MTLAENYVDQLNKGKDATIPSGSSLEFNPSNMVIGFSDGSRASVTSPLIGPMENSVVAQIPFVGKVEASIVVVDET